MLPSTKIFIGISLLITAILLDFMLPSMMSHAVKVEMMPDSHIAGENTDIAAAVGSSDSSHAREVDAMLQGTKTFQVAHHLSSIMMAVGLAMLLLGIHGLAKLVEKVCLQSQSAASSTLLSSPPDV
ncbi:MAG TPA: hypothetical protein VGE39_11570 [Prosthecobacter sp.]